ncbi:MAG: Rieske (2Fe-2S) protein [Leptolyngbya sp. RL_3_1]|nr:Rieske (2Fe-2S) protein [Leptolyngbya sp. RL_3_1]
MKRRDFINWVGLGALATSLPVAIAACQSDDATTPADEPAADVPEVDAAPRADGFGAIGTVAELDAAGSLASKSFQGQQVVVIRDPADAATVLALNSFCTHQGCTVEWESDTALLACPCHGSKFATDGAVTEGPATEALGAFEAKIEDDLVLVKVA